MDWILLYLLMGAIAGVLAGLLGVGGGLVLVPFLAWAFVEQGVSAQWIMQLALGTSLATIVLTSLSSIYAHQKKQAIRWELVWLLAPGIVFGSWGGAQLARWIESSTLQYLFALFELLVALQMGLALQPGAQRQLPGVVGSSTVGGGIGVVSALVGIGGGTLTVPWLVWSQIPVHQAVATSAAVGLPIALSGVAGFIFAGWEVVELPVFSSGFVYWPAWAAIVMVSVLTAPLGARWAHQLPALQLKRLFALLLLLLSIKMFFGLEGQ